MAEAPPSPAMHGGGGEAGGKEGAPLFVGTVAAFSVSRRFLKSTCTEAGVCECAHSPRWRREAAGSSVPLASREPASSLRQDLAVGVGGGVGTEILGDEGQPRSGQCHLLPQAHGLRSHLTLFLSSLLPLFLCLDCLVPLFKVTMAGRKECGGKTRPEPRVREQDRGPAAPWPAVEATVVGWASLSWSRLWTYLTGFGRPAEEAIGGPLSAPCPLPHALCQGLR